MDLKLATGLLLVSICCHTTFAAPTQNAQVVAHKEWVTPGATLKVDDVVSNQFTNNSLSKSMLSKLHRPKSYEGGVFFSVFMKEEQEAKANKDTIVHGLTSTFISNVSSHLKSYTLNSMICTEVTPTNGSMTCGETTDTIQLNPGEMTSFTKGLTLTVQFTEAFTSYAFISTYVMNEQTEESYGASQGGEINVTE